MINLTSLLSGVPETAAACPSADPRPGVAWTMTRRCHLHCIHCYSESDSHHCSDELKWAECRALIHDLADFRVTTLQFSGGDALLHPLFFFVAKYAAERGMRLALLTNGTSLDERAARKLRETGFRDVEIILHGVGATHDHFAGQTGAFAKAMRATRHCQEAGLRTGLRLNLNRQSVAELERIFEIVEAEEIERVGFSHLVHSGRGAGIAGPGPEQTRQALDTIIARLQQWQKRGHPREVFTTDQPADSVYLWMRLQDQDAGRAAVLRKKLESSSSAHLASIDSQGFVHPDAFWQSHPLGNVRETPFSRIWGESKDPVLQNLQSRARPAKGRCGRCQFHDICGGSFRARAWQRYGDAWAEEPACYLSEKEIVAGR